MAQTGFFNKGEREDLSQALQNARQVRNRNSDLLVYYLYMYIVCLYTNVFFIIYSLTYKE